MSIDTETPTTAAPSDTSRAGGTAVWSPSITPPIGRDLTPEQQLACAFRILARGGFSEDIAGHITWTRDDGTLMINPWGLSESSSSPFWISDNGSGLASIYSVTGSGVCRCVMHSQPI